MEALSFAALMLAAGVAGWATVAYLPLWVIWLWLAGAVVILFTILTRTRFYGHVILWIVVWASSVASLVGSYFFTAYRLASHLSIGL